MSGVDKILIKCKQVHFYLLALFPLLSLKLVSSIIILFLVLSIFFFIKNYKKCAQKFYWREFLIYSTPFLLYVFSILWTENLNLGIKIIEKQLSFLIFPLVFFILKPSIEPKHVKSFYCIFISSSALLVLFTGFFILRNLQDIIIHNNEYETTVNLRNAIEQVPLIGEHPIYFSLIVAQGLILLYYHGFKFKWLNFACYILFVLGLLLASSKGIIIAVSIVFVSIIFKEVKSKKNVFIILTLFIIGGGILIYFSPLKNRIHEITQNKHFYPEGIHFNSINLRTAIYNCSFSLIENAGLIGYAPGDTQKELNNCYKKFNTDAFSRTNYNTHNQYLDYLLSFGVIGLFLILLTFYWYLKIALENKNKLYFHFLVFFYLAFLIENVLVRNTGIVLFSFFNCLLAYPIFTKKAND